MGSVRLKFPHFTRPEYNFPGVRLVFESHQHAFELPDRGMHSVLLFRSMSLPLRPPFRYASKCDMISRSRPLVTQGLRNRKIWMADGSWNTPYPYRDVARP